MLKQLFIILISSVLLLTGCGSNKAAGDKALNTLNEYFEVRYSELNSENFNKRIQKMKKYYSDELSTSNSWLVDPMNLESMYHSLADHNIETEILDLSIKHENDNVYNTGVIVKYNSDHVEETYCAEYRFKVTFSNGKIHDIERMAYNVTVVGDNDVNIVNGVLQVGQP